MITDFCKTDMKNDVNVVVEWYDRFSSTAMIMKTDWNEVNLFLKFTT